MTKTFKKLLLPGFIFQSVVIAGGYGTGREIVEYFLQYGPLGGLLGMVLVTTVLWSVILAVTFEFARLFRTYNYREFFKILLGRYWIIFEIMFMIGMLLILAVIGSASGTLLRDNFGINYLIGVILMFCAIGFLTFKGSGLIEKFLASWSILLYLVYGIIFILALNKFGSVISENLSGMEAKPGWAVGGFKYALYNFAVIPAVMFCLVHIETRKEAVLAGVFGGIIGILPAVLFFFAVTSQYPEILPEEVPIMFLLNRIDSTTVIIIFQIVLFGTLIETGTGFIHAFNERIRSLYESRKKEFPGYLRPVNAVILLLAGLFISRYGLINLIAKGYGALSWGFFAVFVIPLFTLGIYKIYKSGNSGNNQPLNNSE
ncbi:hypothetical protein ACFL7D_06745 [candidate division KSB1 bacterium]